jgi:NADPH:quinone reductase-like Zn-dependent oxidoreductase
MLSIMMNSVTNIVKIGDIPFENATSAFSVYAAMSALILHLDLEKPTLEAPERNESVLIWGGGSSLGLYAVQIAAQVGQYLAFNTISIN